MISLRTDNTIALTIGMHYNNPLCRGVISIGHNEANGLNANGRAVFSVLYDNTHLGEKQQLIFTYEQGDILRLEYAILPGYAFFPLASAALTETIVWLAGAGSTTPASSTCSRWRRRTTPASAANPAGRG